MMQNTSHAVMAQREKTMRRHQALIGETFNDLTVIATAEKRGKHNYIKCRCTCGIVKDFRLSHVLAGASKSCGCLAIRNNKSRSTHGYSRGIGGRRPEYSAWSDAKKRCFNANATHYEYYGGRGITMCARWTSSFSAFLEDMGECPSGMTLDRINPDGDYEPGNCRWASMKEQSRNRRSSVFVQYNGVSMTLAEVAERLGVSYKALHYEHRTKNLPLDAAISRAKARLGEPR